MSKEREIFIKENAQAVINATRGSGIFPSVKMAQMIIESADSKGRSGFGITAIKAKNYFGIKADPAWTGPKMSFNTPNDGKKISFFRVYKSVQDSVADHNNFLKRNSRYASAGVFTAKTPEEQAMALSLAGYSERPHPIYANALIAQINAYHLKDLDKQAGLPDQESSSSPIIVGLAIGLTLLYLAK